MDRHPKRRASSRWLSHAARASLLAGVVLSPAACQSSGSRPSSFRWPWKKNSDKVEGDLDKAAPPPAEQDPFLPPPSPRPANIDGNAQRDNGRPGPGDVANAAYAQEHIALVAATGTNARQLLQRRLAASTDDLSGIVAPVGAPRDFQYIILHHSRSESGNLQTVDQIHRRVLGWEGCGYHFVIGNGNGAKDGLIEASNRWELQKHGAHLSSKAPAVYNLRGIGICLVGNLERQPPTARQVQAAKDLIAYLMDAYNIPPYRVLSHSEVTQNGQHGSCPGKYLNVASLVASR